MIGRFWQALRTWLVLAESFDASALAHTVKVNPKWHLLLEKFRPVESEKLAEIAPGFRVRRNRYDAGVVISMPAEYGIVEWNFGGRELTVVDAGANIGAFALYLSSFATIRRYVGVEAAPANHEVLLRNVRAMGESFTAVQCALAAEEGEIVFNTSGNPSRFGKTSEGLRLRGMPLDAIEEVRDCGPIDILKMDVEGSEEQVLAGGAETLRRTDCVLMEIHHADIGDEATARIFETMNGHGFSVVIFQRSPDGRQSNGLFRKRGRVDSKGGEPE